MNPHSEFEASWKEIKSEIERTWPELNSSEIEAAKFDLVRLASKLQKQFGYAKEEVQLRINDILKRRRGSGERAIL